MPFHRYTDFSNICGPLRLTRSWECVFCLWSAWRTDESCSLMCSSRAFGFSASLSCSVQSPNTLFLDTEDRCEPTFLASVCSVMAVLGLWGSEQRTITLTRRWLPISTTLGSTEESLRRPAPSAGVADFAWGLLAFLFASVCLSADCLMYYQELHPTLHRPFLRH